MTQTNSSNGDQSPSAPPVRRSHILYEAYGSLRRKSVAAGLKKIEDFLSQLADSSEPNRVDLSVRQRSNRRVTGAASDQESPLVQGAVQRFGEATRNSGRHYVEWQWTRTDSTWRQLYAFLLEHETVPKLKLGDEAINQVELTLEYEFRFVDSGTKQPLPFQEPSNHLFAEHATSTIRVDLGANNNHASIDLRFPFQEADGAFVAYSNQAELALKQKLGRNQFRIIKPNKAGTNTYPLKIDFWPAPDTEQGAAQAPRNDLDADAMLQQIYENPDDHALRLVCADRLQELGDCRGELITLQCANASGAPGKIARNRRIKQIMATDLNRMLGTLAPHALKTGLKFDRGFVSECWLKLKHPLPGTHAQMSTLRALHFRERSGVAENIGSLLSGRPLAGLQTLTGIDIRTALNVACCKHPLALKTLFFGAPHEWEEIGAATVLNKMSLKTFPVLRSLGVMPFIDADTWSPEKLTRFLQRPVGQRVEELTVFGRPHHYEAWLTAIEAADTPCLRRVKMLDHGGHFERDHKRWSATVTRGDDGRLSMLHLSYFNQRLASDTLDELGTALAALPPQSISCVQFTSTKALTASTEVITALRQAPTTLLFVDGKPI